MQQQNLLTRSSSTTALVASLAFSSFSTFGPKWRTVEVHLYNDEVRRYSFREMDLAKCQIFQGWKQWPKGTCPRLDLPEEIDIDAFEATLSLIKGDKLAREIMTTPLVATKIFEVTQYLGCDEFADICVEFIHNLLVANMTNAEGFHFPEAHYQEILNVAEDYNFEEIEELCREALGKTKCGDSPLVTTQETCQMGKEMREAPRNVEIVTTHHTEESNKVQNPSERSEPDPWVTEQHGRKLIFFGPSDKTEGSPKPLLKRQVSRLLAKIEAHDSHSTKQNITPSRQPAPVIAPSEFGVGVLPSPDVPPKTKDIILAMAVTNELVSPEEARDWLNNYKLGPESEAGRAINTKYGL